MRKEFTKAKVTFDQVISCHHNYVSEERYDGVDLLVTRKGAIRAGSGDFGIIPGSMGTGSYIVRGLGNAAAFNSASHGAGRRMSRNAAKKRFTARRPGGPDRAASSAARTRAWWTRSRARTSPSNGHRAAAGPGRGGREAEAGGLREGLSGPFGVRGGRPSEL